MNIQTYKPVTTAQIKKIHVLLQQKGLMDEKEAMVYSISGNRTGSTKELTCYEAKQMISFLLDEAKTVKSEIEKTYRAIWAIAWKMEIIYGKTDDDFQMNRAKLNVLCRERGAIKKNLYEMNLYEIRKVLVQFKMMFKKHLNSKKTINK